MCHDDDSRPPSPPVVGEVARHGSLTLTAADGTVLSAYEAVPAEPLGRNVVVLPDVRGLHPYYEQLTVRLAEAGFHAVAFDYFGRTAGVGDRGDDFDWQSLFSSVTADTVGADARAAVDHLRSAHPGPTFTLGFCFGGSQSWRLSASDLGLAGAMGFYDRPSLIADVEDSLSAPLLLLVGGGDAATPVDEIVALEARLAERGVAHEMHVYDGAPHSFFDRGFADWQDACSDAWVRILDFTAAHS